MWRFFPRTHLLLAFALLLAGTVIASDDSQPEWRTKDTERLSGLAREYMEKTTAGEKDDVLARAREMGPIPPRKIKAVVKALFKVARSGPKSDGKGSCTAKFPRFPGTYYLTGAGGGKKGIFIGLHGGGAGVGDGRSAQSQWGAAAGKGLIGVFPTANIKGWPERTTWQHRDVNEFVLAILKELKRTYRIDTNRIYVAGHSLGGSGAYHIGLRFADLFAAVSPNAGGLHGMTLDGGEASLPGGFVANLYNTPIYLTHYDGDPRVGVAAARGVAKELAALKKEHPDGYEHVYVEGKGVNHGFPPKSGPSKIINWMTSRKRDPYPRKVVWEPCYPEKRLFFWLRRSRPPSGTSRGSRIVATIDDNHVNVTARQTKGVSILLSEEMFDPREEVVVTLNGEEHSRGLLDVDPGTLLECILENIDPAQLFTHRLDL